MWSSDKRARAHTHTHISNEMETEGRLWAPSNAEGIVLWCKTVFSRNVYPDTPFSRAVTVSDLEVTPHYCLAAPAISLNITAELIMDV